MSDAPTVSPTARWGDARCAVYRPIALALVRRTTPVDAALVVATGDGAVAAAQEVIVPPEAGRTAAVPRLPRLSRRR